MSDRLKIAQISDIHVLGKDVLYQDIDVCGNFLTALQAVQEENVDLIILSGDLAAERGEPEAYEWVQEVMSTIETPYEVMVGNHDSLDIMKQYFPMEKDIHQGKHFFARTINDKRLFFLDSGNHIVDDFQWQWLLEQQKDVGMEQEGLLFIHHPPALANHGFMDKRYSLKNIEESRKYLQMMSNIHNIFVGHYHFEKIVMQDGKNIHITPSTMMQISPGHSEFHLEHTRPGWRIIEWSKGRIDTEVHYGLEKPADPDRLRLI
jgi:3',5'-cyclic-AMP phosphodiesterase